MKSPCLHCTRVKDPSNCENKTCKEWQAWFISRWEAMRANIRADIDQAPLTEHGVPWVGIAMPPLTEFGNLCPKIPVKPVIVPRMYAPRPAS